MYITVQTNLMPTADIDTSGGLHRGPTPLAGRGSLCPHMAIKSSATLEGSHLGLVSRAETMSPCHSDPTRATPGSALFLYCTSQISRAKQCWI